MKKLGNYINEINSNLFISLEKDDENKIINDNFIDNIFKIALFSIIVLIFQSVLSIFYFYKIFINDPISPTYFFVTILQIIFLSFFVEYIICSYKKKSLTLYKQKVLTYSYLVIYLLFQVFFVSSDFLATGTLVGFFFDLLVIGVGVLLRRRITYAYLISYTFVLFTTVYILDGNDTLIFNISLNAAFLSLLGFYIIANYTRNLHLKNLYLKSESERLANLHEDNNKKLYVLNQQLQSISTTDSLTKIPNRRAFDNHINKIWFQCFREQRLLTIFMIDIDDFKRYNDAFGHQNGDKVLQSIAYTMSNTLKRKDDLIARYGGEEFIAALPYTREENMLKFAESLIENISNLKIKTPSISNREFVTISIGIATCVPSSEIEFEELVEQADKALYKAKNSGKNCYFIYDSNEDYKDFKSKVCVH